MNFTVYKIMMLNKYEKRFFTISNFHYTKQDANKWIKLYDPDNKQTIKIKSELRNLKDVYKSFDEFILKDLSDENRIQVFKMICLLQNIPEQLNQSEVKIFG